MMRTRSTAAQMGQTHVTALELTAHARRVHSRLMLPSAVCLKKLSQSIGTHKHVQKFVKLS